MPRQLSTVRFTFAILTSFILIAVFVIWQIINQPWLGLDFIAPPNGDGLIVASVTKNGPAFNHLKIDQHIRLIKGAHDTVLLSVQLLKSTDAFPSYKAFNESLARHQQVANILKEQTVTFVLDNGEEIAIAPSKRHPVSTIPIIYFLYLLSGFFCVSIGLLFWHYQLRSFVTHLILFAGIGMFVYYLSVVLQYRELALPADWLHMTTAGSIVGTNISGWGCFVIFMVYPFRIFSNRVVLVLLAFTLLMALNSILQWKELPFHAYMFQFSIMGLVVYSLLFWQWRITQGHPVERAVVKLFIMIMIIPNALVVFLWLIPIVLESPAHMLHELARFTFVPIVLSWAIAMFHFKLFYVEKWWFFSIMWLIGVFLLLVPYVIFIDLMNFDVLLAFSLSVMIGGCLYYPIQQRLLPYFLPELSNSIHDTLSKFVHSLQTAVNDADFQDAWRKTLDERFCPVGIKYLMGAQEKITFKEEGKIIQVPNVVEGSSYELLGKSQGNRLFNMQDVRAMESLLMLARAILQASRVREEATFTERTRIMRDLHDSLGAKLLSMLQRNRGHSSENDAREALQTLRDTVHLSTINEPQKLLDLLGEWRMETQERVEIMNVRLHWLVEECEDELKVGSGQVLLLRSFLRETISNSLKHAQPENIFVRIEQSFEWLKLSVENDGCVVEPKEWKLGFGLSHLRERFIRTGGKLEISRRQTDERKIVVEVLAVIYL